jgi:hypothetical protein
MFGRQRRKAELDAIQAALAADAEARAALVDALARIDGRLAHGLEEQARTQNVTDGTVQHLRATVVDTRNDLARAVEHLAQVCSMLSDRIDAERIERAALVEAMGQLARPAAIERPRSGERVLGGSFPATPAESIDVTVETESRQSHWV